MMKPKREFVVGQRVAVYSGTQRFVSEIKSIDLKNKRLIVKSYSNDYHFFQCRHIKPKREKIVLDDVDWDGDELVYPLEKKCKFDWHSLVGKRTRVVIEVLRDE